MLNRSVFWVIARWLLIYGLFWFLAWQRLDPDFGWHLQSGNYIREHGLPTDDIFSYTAVNFHWINHEWGYDVLVSWLYQLGGYGLLASIFAGLWTTALWLVGRRVNLTILLAAAVAVLPYAGIRPMVWSVLFLALLIRLATTLQGRSLLQGSSLQGQGRWVKFWIPVLFIIWANLHGGFIIGLAYLAYLAISQRSRRWLLVLAASLLATFINPYGWGLYVEIGRTLFDSSLHNQINEWRALFILPPSWAYLVLYLSGFWLFARQKLSNWLSFQILLLLATAAASRNLPLLVVATLKDTGDYFQKARLMIPKKLQLRKKLVLGVMIAAIVIEVANGLYVSFRPWQPRDFNYPKVAVSYLQNHACPGQIFNDYNYGGYLIWQLPKNKIFLDGRMPSWRDSHGQKYLDIYYKILDNPSYRKKAFAQYDIKCLLLGNGRQPSMIADLKKQGWRPAVTANGATLLIK